MQNLAVFERAQTFEEVAPLNGFNRNVGQAIRWRFTEDESGRAAMHISDLHVGQCGRGQLIDVRRRWNATVI